MRSDSPRATGEEGGDRVCPKAAPLPSRPERSAGTVEAVTTACRTCQRQNRDTSENTRGALNRGGAGKPGQSLATWEERLPHRSLSAE